VKGGWARMASTVKSEDLCAVLPLHILWLDWMTRDGPVMM
jgi:hypothetical protein